MRRGRRWEGRGSGWFGEALRAGVGDRGLGIGGRGLGSVIYFGGMGRRGLGVVLIACAIGVGAEGERPAISAIHPTSGPAGTVVKVTGKGFLPTSGRLGSSGGDFGGNTVHLGPRVEIKNQNSEDGVTLEFTVPEKLASGTYPVSIRNANGASNAVQFTVTRR